MDGISSGASFEDDGDRGRLDMRRRGESIWSAGEMVFLADQSGMGA